MQRRPTHQPYGGRPAAIRPKQQALPPAAYVQPPATIYGASNDDEPVSQLSTYSTENSSQHGEWNSATSQGSAAFNNAPLAQSSVSSGSHQPKRGGIARFQKNNGRPPALGGQFSKNSSIKNSALNWKPTLQNRITTTVTPQQPTNIGGIFGATRRPVPQRVSHTEAALNADGMALGEL